jgi:pSer/pThr/pTyr-binding forkhead associated (FHA) protein
MTETDAFKVPPIPIEETKPTETSTTTSTDESSDVPLVRHKGLQYNVPDSSSIPSHQYALEVLRNGTIVDNIDLCQRAYTVFGRAPDSDVILENPTISRYHAIIQYKSEFEHGQPAGLYLYDCGSTHGTFINKKRIEPKVYIRIKIDHLIKFGQSTRLYVVQGDSSIDEDTSMSGTGDDVTHEQMKKFHAKRAKALASVRAKRESMASEANGNATEMDWGMGPDVDETALNAAAETEATEAMVEKHRKNIEQEEEMKRKSAADDLKNRIEYQKAKSDQNVLKEIMSRVSRLRDTSQLKINLNFNCFLFRSMPKLQIKTIQQRKKNHFI